MQKLLKTLLLTTSIAVVGIFSVSVVADNVFTMVIDGAKTIKSGYEDVKDVVQFGSDVKKDVSGVVQTFSPGTKVKNAAGVVGTVQKNGQVLSDAGKVLGKVNVGSGTGGVKTFVDSSGNLTVSTDVAGKSASDFSKSLMPNGAGTVTTSDQYGSGWFSWQTAESDPNAVANAIKNAGLAGQQNTSSLANAGQSGIQNVAGGAKTWTSADLANARAGELGNGVIKNTDGTFQMGGGSSKMLSESEALSQLNGGGTQSLTGASKYSMSDITGTKPGTELGDTGFVKQTDGNGWMKGGEHFSDSQVAQELGTNPTSGWKEAVTPDQGKGWVDENNVFHTDEEYQQLNNEWNTNQKAVDPKTEAGADAKTGEGDGGSGAGTKGQEASVFNHKAITQNYLQYALLITAAALAENDWKETKETKVMAELLERTQAESDDLSVGSQSALDGTTIAGAAESMALLLTNNAIDYDPLLSKEVTSSGTAGVGLGGGGSAGGGGTVITDGNRYVKTIKRRRERLYQLYSMSAAMIAAGSNAISSRFYDRLSAYVAAINATEGTLGGLSGINDSERMVMFEMSRGAALSATELGLKGTATLKELDVLEEASHGS